MCTPFTLLNASWAPGPNAASRSLPPETRSSSVWAMARGCSWISLSMKCRYGPRSTASAVSWLSSTARVARAPSESMTVIAVRRTSATSPSSRNMKRRVTGSRAATSSDEVLVDAEADHDGTPLAGEHDGLWIALRHHRQGVSPFELGDGLTHRLVKTAARGQMMMDSMRDHLGVCLRIEGVAQLREPGAQCLVILDDSV